MNDWIQIYPADLENYLLPTQLKALSSKNLGMSPERLQLLLDDIVLQIRAAIASHSQYYLSEEQGRIPPELRVTCCYLCLEMLQNRVPFLRLTPDQIRRCDESRKLVDKIRRGEATVLAPKNPDWRVTYEKTTGISCLKNRKDHLRSEFLSGL